MLWYLSGIILSIIVGGCAGGILGKLCSLQSPNYGKGLVLAIILASGGIYLFILLALFNYMKLRGVGSGPLIASVVTLILSAFFAFIGGLRDKSM